VGTASREGAALFVALAGERFDGHDFIPAFYQNGGKAVISHRETDGPNVILVEDTLRALGDLAGYYRCRFSLPVVGITGSAGKTSTRRMTEGVLSGAGAVCATQGNLNNEVGLPRTLLTMHGAHRFAVVEMGMNHAGEIRYLAKIARPDIAVITNIGTAHIGNLGSREGILRAKLEILEGLPPDGLAILNGDDASLFAQRDSLSCRRLFYGIRNPACDLLADNVACGALGSEFRAAGGSFTLRAPGAHHVYNALAAIAVGLECKLPLADIQKGVEKFAAADMRQTILEAGGLRIIEDCYNANGDSMRAALAVLAGSGARRKIAILGDMYELGEFARGEHRRVGECAARHGIDLLIAVGEYAAFIAERARAGGVEVIRAGSNREALETALGLVREGDTVLVKASRGAKFEEISRGLFAGLA
jgi:UDP-N-acetylmuramoyl-tripeptide--D-alanyl-D-alanine ligase